MITENNFQYQGMCIQYECVCREKDNAMVKTALSCVGVKVASNEMDCDRNEAASPCERSKGGRQKSTQ
jgi:hypothetical protein